MQPSPVMPTADSSYVRLYTPKPPLGNLQTIEGMARALKCATVVEGRKISLSGYTTPVPYKSLLNRVILLLKKEDSENISSQFVIHKIRYLSHHMNYSMRELIQHSFASLFCCCPLTIGCKESYIECYERDRYHFAEEQENPNNEV